MKPHRKACSLTAAIITFGSLVGGANAALVFNFSEGAGVVNLDVSGSVNLAATLDAGNSATNTGLWFTPTAGSILGGSPVTSTFYSVSDAWTAFGTGFNSGNALSGSGDRVALFTGAIGVPTGYIAGASLSGTNSWTGTFDSLGMAPGSYTTTFTNASISDTVTVNVGPVPEPSSASLLVLSAIGAMVRRRRVKRRIQI